MRTSFLQGPRLNTNVNTNSGYSGFGQILMNDATRGLNRNEKKRQSNLDNAYKDKVFNQNKARDERNFNYQKTRDETKDTQWKTIFNNRVSQQNKPNYSTVPTLDNEGNPTIKLFDKNSGNFKDTQLTPYTKPKQLSPEREAYYQARNEELNQKRINNMVKSLELQYPGIGEEERIKAINYINQNGQMPIIKYDNGWGFFRPNSWGGRDKGYYVSMDKNSKTKAQKQLEKDMKLLGL